MQKQYLQEIDENYIPKLNNYAVEVDNLISDATQKVVNSISENNKYTLNENIESLKMNREVIISYKDYLLKNRNDIAQKNKRLQEDIHTAEHTYRTVLLSSNIASILRHSTRHFETLTTLTIPKLSGFQNQQMKEEFHKLTARMQNAS